MNRCCLRSRLVQEVAGPFHLVGRSVENQEKLVVLHLGLVLQDAVLRNPDAVQARAEGAITCAELRSRVCFLKAYSAGD